MSVQRYVPKRRPVTEALQWTGGEESLQELARFLGDKLRVSESGESRRVLVETAYGRHALLLGEYVIKSAVGRVSFKAADEFETEYELLPGGLD